MLAFTTDNNEAPPPVVIKEPAPTPTEEPVIPPRVEFEEVEFEDGRTAICFYMADRFDCEIK